VTIAPGAGRRLQIFLNAAIRGNPETDLTSLMENGMNIPRNKFCGLFVPF
jgi:hypothetical protein